MIDIIFFKYTFFNEIYFQLLFENNILFFPVSSISNQRQLFNIPDKIVINLAKRNVLDYIKWGHQ